MLIQLGAILAILLVYFRQLLAIAHGAADDPQARRFVLGVLVAFLPAAIIGALLHGFIKGVLFNPLDRLHHADRRRLGAAASSTRCSSRTRYNDATKFPAARCT